ncbi:beta-sarcoglycan [Chironomus tepperi]|uniref:beta-sarcoglycan n=1 Tax=Chironomus tepperi TaxID=113505 RepID=UPI00391F7C51
MGKANNCGKINLNDPTSIFFWGLIIVLFILVVGNFILTLSIISFFKIGIGMPIQLIPEWNTVKFHGSVDFLKVFKKDGQLESFKDTPAVIESDEGSIKFNLIDRKNQVHSRFVMENDGIEVKGLNVLSVRDPKTNLPIFTTSSKQVYHLEKPTKNLESSFINAREIVSPIDKKLEIQSINMFVRGSEGTVMDGKEVLISAGENIILKSSNGSIGLKAQNGIELEFQKLPIVDKQRNSDLQYKLCVCYPKGVLYRVPLMKLHDSKDPCRDFDKSYFNPCI